MHPIHIRIGGDDHIIETESFQSFFNIQGVLKQVEFFVFVNNFFVRPKQLSGLPRRLKTAWVSTFRALVMDPLALSPSVMKMVVSFCLATNSSLFLAGASSSR